MLNKIFLDKHNSVGLYIHIPFCRRKCSYCDFFSVPNNKKGEKKAYLSFLAAVIEHIKFFFTEMDFPPVHTVYIGGGTPSSIDITSMDIFLSSLEDIIQNKNVCEFTMEVNPEDVNKNFLSMLKSHRVNRLSMGVQSIDTKVIETLGRNTDRIRILAALELLGKNWNRRKSFDLINCVPGQSKTSALEDIKIVSSFNPDHISVYNLTFEKNTPLYHQLVDGKIKKLSEEKIFSIYSKTTELLESIGYKRYEISNFAQPGNESIHNQRYWKMLPYLGIGPGAVSTLKGKEYPLRIEYNRNITGFVSNGILQNLNIETMPANSFLLEHLIMGLRMIKGVNIAKINSIFSIDLLSALDKTLNKWSKNIEISNGMFYLNAKGLAFLNSFLLDAALELENIDVQSCFWPYNHH